jgi:enterochelin esterase-like enzyme
LSAPSLSPRFQHIRLAIIWLAALVVGGCSIQSFSPLLHAGIQTATPTACGCQLETVEIPSRAMPTPSASPSIQPPAASQGPAVAESQTPQPTNGEEVIGATQDDTPHLPLQGQVVSGEVTTSLLKQPLGYLVYLPPGYDSQAARRYPVLFLLHGQGSTDDQWVHLGINAAADRLIEAGEISPMIIVMPYEVDSPVPEQTNFGQAVVSVLVPWIDAHYLTQAERAERAIGGLSRGAAWAMRLGLIYWQIFGAIGAHSYPMFYGDGPLIPKWLAAIPPESYPRIYLDVGKSDPGIQVVQDFEAYLTDQGIPHEFHMYTGYHEESYWQTHLDDYLRWYANGW